MTTQEILSLLRQILVTLAGLVAPMSVLLREAQVFARENTPFHISNQVDAIATNLNDPTHGLAALQSQIATFQATTAVDVTSILTAIAATQQTGSPVTLPTTPPAGYGFNTTSDVAAIWAFTDPTYSQPMYLEVGFTYATTTLMEQNWLMLHQQAPYFGVALDPTQNYLLGYPSWWPPQFDLSTLGPTDTVLSILAASNPAITFTLMPDGQHYHYNVPSPYDGHVVCLVDDAWLEQLKLAVLPSTTTETAPVWPGLANVTLGSPVAIGTTFSVTGPMDGVIVVITSVPSKQGQFMFGGTISWRNVGAISFVSDNGNSEYPQTLGFESAVYSPKAMATASGLVGRATAGVTGTVTPWTIT